ncbi:hypothetical protein J6590_073789 [Homalodisca vitripennis]|nr:hypothetical protein J6590_073789 [Homalodisca vitripennis]
MSLVNVETNSVIFNQFSILDGPITQVKLFSLAPKDIHPPNVLKSLEVEERDCNPDPLKNDLHLIVCSALVPTVVYMNIQEQGFVERQILSESDHYDVNLCACVADINFDGFHEILLGTFGKEYPPLLTLTPALATVYSWIILVMKHLAALYLVSTTNEVDAA